MSTDKNIEIHKNALTIARMSTRKRLPLVFMALGIDVGQWSGQWRMKGKIVRDAVLVFKGVKCDTNTDDISWKRLAIKTNVTSLRERESLFMSWIHSGTFRVQICDWSVIINDLPVFICQRIYGLLACLSGSRQMARNIPEFSGRTPHSNKYFHIFALPRPQPPYIRTQKEPLSFSWNLSTRNE